MRHDDHVSRPASDSNLAISDSSRMKQPAFDCATHTPAHADSARIDHGGWTTSDESDQKPGCPSAHAFIGDDPDFFPAEEDWLLSTSCPPKAQPQSSSGHAQAIPAPAIYLLLSLAVHISMVLFPASTPPPRPMPILEFSFGALEGGRRGKGPAPGGEQGSGSEGLPLSSPAGQGAPVDAAAMQALPQPEATPRAVPPAPPTDLERSKRETATQRPAEIQKTPQKERIAPQQQKTERVTANQQKQPRAAQTTGHRQNKHTASTKPSPPTSPTQGATDPSAAQHAAGMSGSSPKGSDHSDGPPSASGIGGSDGSGSGRGGGFGSGSGLEGGSGTGSGQPVTFGAGQGPSFARQVKPAYPRQAMARKEEGEVKLMLHLDEQGSMIQVEVLQSAGPRLDAAALEAAKASAYRPAMQEGRPKACRAILAMKFSLRG